MHTSVDQNSGEFHLDLLNELHQASSIILRRISTEDINRIASTINSARTIYILGVGHSGIVARTFSMKLNHVGVRAYTVFDEINPPFDDRSILIAISQSGETRTVVALSEKARAIGGRVLALTGNVESTLGRKSDYVLELSLGDTDIAISALSVFGDSDNQNVRGAVFGSVLYTLFYAIVIKIADLRGESPASINARHANLE